MILCFAIFGMVMTGNKVFADPNDGEEPGEGGGGGLELYLHDCSNYNTYRYCSVQKTHLSCDNWRKCPD
jgi:hypothetical protein